MFKDRQEAGRLLAEELKKYRNSNSVVYALPRGGVVIGYEVARSLPAPLDLVITRKIGHPHNPEYAICAVSESGELLCNEYAQQVVGSGWIHDEAKRQIREAKRRRRAYLGRESLPANGKIAIIVDDGIATGLSMSLAVDVLKKQNPKKIVVAVPVAPPDAIEALRGQGAEVVYLEDPHHFLGSVGAHYASFPQVEDDEVIALLKKPYEKRNNGD